MGLMRGRDPLIRGSSRSSSNEWAAWVLLVSGADPWEPSLLPLQKLLDREGIDFKLLNLWLGPGMPEGLCCCCSSGALALSCAAPGWSGDEPFFCTVA